MRYAIRTVIAIAVLAVTTAFSLAEEKEKIPHDDAVSEEVIQPVPDPYYGMLECEIVRGDAEAYK